MLFVKMGLDLIDRRRFSFSVVVLSQYTEFKTINPQTRHQEKENAAISSKGSGNQVKGQKSQ